MKPKFSTLIAVLALIPVLYVLSIGPAWRYFANEDDWFRRQERLKRLYVPLIWLCKRTGASEALDWYVGLWIGPSWEHVPRLEDSWSE